MSERMTDRSHRVMRFAKQEASRWNHDHVDCEHLLIGLFKESSGIAGAVMQMAGITKEKLQKAAEQFHSRGPAESAGDKLSPTPKLAATIQMASGEAEALGHNYIGTEHLLLALCRDQESNAAKMLRLLEVNPDDLVADVMRMLSCGHEATTSQQKLFDDCLAAFGEIETELRSVASKHGLKFNEMRICPGCSQAGGANREAIHREPICEAR